MNAHASRRAVWGAGLGVAAGAGVATAHGLYQVAAAAHVPNVIAWLYPLITDGLALVAYAATSRLPSGGRRYAATIVVLAAGLSGLAQAVYLAGGIADTTAAPVGLRFGVGAWPAIAAALTAHLLHLISADNSASDTTTSNPAAFSTAPNASVVQPPTPASVHSYNPTATTADVQTQRPTEQPAEPGVQAAAADGVEHTRTPASNAGRSGSGGGASSASDRARHAARTHYAHHGDLPTATELMAQAQVSRGTAGTVLKDLRDNRPALHIVNADTDSRTDQ